MDFGAGALGRDVTARGSLPLHVVEAQIGRYLLPAHTLVARAKYLVAGGIEHVAVIRREHDRESPGEAVPHVLGRDARRFFRPDVDELELLRAVVVALQRAGATGARA